MEGITLEQILGGAVAGILVAQKTGGMKVRVENALVEFGELGIVVVQFFFDEPVQHADVPLRPVDFTERERLPLQNEVAALQAVEQLHFRPAYQVRLQLGGQG